ncbi:MAG: hypothetical protein FJ109_01660 [Deltaproteobacteria bacterium]|nr:hypothetical protein [Deltaproteobacteria bacterium]
MRISLQAHLSGLAACLAGVILFSACGGGSTGEEATTDADASVFADIPVKPGGGNHPPKLHKVGNKEVQVNEALEVVLTADDADGDTLTFSVYGDMPAEAKFYKPEGRFAWQPTAPGGPYFVTFVVSDMKDFDSETVELRAVSTKTQHAPKFVNPGDQFLKIGVLYELRLDATDEDGDNLYFTLLGAPPAGATFDAPNATFRWTPGAADAGTVARVNFQVTDGSLSDQMEVKLVVAGGEQSNHPPEVKEIAPIDAVVGQPLSFEIKATDPDGDTLTFAYQGELPAGAQFNPGTHVFNWTPGQSYSGKTVTVQFVISDAQFTVKLSVTILVKGEAGQCNDDQYEPANNSAQTAPLINQGSFQGLSICDTTTSPIDEDWFKLDLLSGEHLTAVITFSHQLGDLDMALYSQSNLQKPVFYSPGVGDEEVVDYGATAPGAYFLRIVGTGAGKYASPYVLTVTRTQGSTCSKDPKEPNDTLSQATPLGPADTAGNPITGLSICPGDTDVFAVDLQCGDELAAGIDFVDANGDLDLYLVDKTGEIIIDQSAKPATNTETVAMNGAAEAGKVHIVVVGYPKETTANTYKLEVYKESGLSCSADASEPNDSAGQAKSIGSTQVLSNLTLCCDKDFFSFPAANGKVTVKLTFPAAASVSAQFFPSSSPSQTTGLVCGAGSCSGQKDLTPSSTLVLSISGTFGTAYTLDATVDAGGTGSNSCQGHCGGKSGNCYCDGYCSEYGDCCADICQWCGC